MIDKLGRNTFVSMEDGTRITSPPDMNQVMDKINELVDFANGLSYNEIEESHSDDIDIEDLIEQLTGYATTTLLGKTVWYKRYERR